MSAVLKGRYTSSQSEFFTRNAGFPQFAEFVAPGLAAARGGEPLLIADVGCSVGKSALCLGAALLAAGVDMRIEGWDIKDEKLEQARSGRYEHAQGLGDDLRQSPFPDACLNDFVFADYHTINGLAKNFWVEPSERLRRRTSYGKHDIVTDPLPAARYDAAAVHNLAGHYRDDPAAVDRIIGHTVAGLRPGGVLLFDDHTHILSTWLQVHITPEMQEQYSLSPSLAVPPDVQYNVWTYNPSTGEAA